MRELSDKMVIGFGARPHYGKQNHLNKEQMKLIYGQRYEDFVKIKNKYDPDGVFSNHYIEERI